MADALYQEMRNAMLGAPTHSVVDLNLDDVRVILRDEGADALNLADQDLADIVAGARIAVSATVGVVAVGTFDHANITFTAVSGASVESLDYYKHTGTESNSPLICNIDSATGLPVTPNGGDITWAPHANGVFQIT
jgi:hypothetical protein